PVMLLIASVRHFYSSMAFVCHESVEVDIGFAHIIDIIRRSVTQIYFTGEHYRLANKEFETCTNRECCIDNRVNRLVWIVRQSLPLCREVAKVFFFTIYCVSIRIAIEGAYSCKNVWGKLAFECAHRQ